MRLRIFYASRDCRPISQFGFNELRGTSQSFRALCVPTNGRCRLVIYITSPLHSLARIGQFSMSDHLISTSTNNRANNIASFVEYRRS